MKHVQATKTRGFSLIEVMIYVALMSMTMVMLTDIYGSLLRAKTRADNQRELYDNARVAVQSMSEAIRWADSVVTAQSNELALLKGTETTTYRLQNGVITVQQDAGAITPLTTDAVEITQLNVSEIEGLNPTTNSSVQFELRAHLRQANTADDNEITLATTVFLRGN
jgi:type II secretory pathway pseudopilin PulG